MDASLLTLLERTSLSDKQRKAYLALLQLGEATISQIADLAQIKRPNAYVVLQELELLGYVHPLLGTKIKRYAASDPKKLSAELKENSKNFDEMLPYLHAIQRRSDKPNVQYYKGIKQLEKAFAQIYKPKEARYIGSIDKAQKAIPNEVRRWQQVYLSGKAMPRGRHILTDTEADRVHGVLVEKNGQKVRYFKPDVDINVDIAIVDNKVCLTSFEGEMSMTIIKSESTYNALATLYDLAWDNLSQKSKD